MKIVSWNVAGLRAILKKDCFHEFLNKEDNENFNIICLQETKCESHQVTIPDYINTRYPHRFWNSTQGTSQRKGLSGVSIWCDSPPIKQFPCPEFDQEGRILALEFQEFILINVYVPNSQKLECERYYFREKWNMDFMDYINVLEKTKPVVVCGDMNVAHLDIDISNPKAKKNKVAGFFDMERRDFSYLLQECNLVDVFRKLNPDRRKSTYWSNFLKSGRTQENGWGIDYFLITDHLYDTKFVNDCKIYIEILGSDHCPVVLETA